MIDFHSLYRTVNRTLNTIELAEKARTTGHDHGWRHANFCEAYGWTNHTSSLQYSPRQFLHYLLAGTRLELADAELEIYALDIYCDYVAGIAEGIAAYENQEICHE